MRSSSGSLLLIAVTLVTAAAWLAVAPARAARPPVLIDEVWTSPDFGRHPVRTVAVLPAVALESYAPNHPLSDSLAIGFRGDGRRWVPPLSTWHGLGNSEIERLAEFRKIADEVRQQGRTRPATTARLAQRLGVDALMIVRVDRWERIPDATDVTTVEARAELVSADGTPLWRVSGRSRVYTASYRPRAELPKPSQGNKLLETRVSGGGSGGNSGGSGGSSGSSATAGSSTGGGSSGSQGSSQSTRTTTKLEYKETPLEDLVRVRDPGQPELSLDPFQKASSQMVAAWATRRPAPFLAGGAARDTTR